MCTVLSSACWGLAPVSGQHNFYVAWSMHTMPACRLGLRTRVTSHLSPSRHRRHSGEPAHPSTTRTPRSSQSHEAQSSIVLLFLSHGVHLHQIKPQLLFTRKRQHSRTQTHSQDTAVDSSLCSSRAQPSEAGSETSAVLRVRLPRSKEDVATHLDTQRAAATKYLRAEVKLVTGAQLSEAGS